MLNKTRLFGVHVPLRPATCERVVSGMWLVPGSLISAWPLLSLLCAMGAGACSSTATGDRQPLTVGTGGESSSESLQSCVPGAIRTCHCADGQLTGVQNCLAGGELTACAGCRTGSAMAEETREAVNDGALCKELSGQSGCKDENYRSEELPASILFVVDRSGSMLCNAPEYGQSVEECQAQASTKFPDKPTKWDSTAAALSQVFSGLVGSGASAGLSFFSNNDVCGVHSIPTLPVKPVDANQAVQLADALRDTIPGGGTPIVGATTLAYAHLYEEAGLDANGGCANPPCGARGNRFVVLITDGADSCPTEPFSGACGGLSCTDFLLDHGVIEAASVNIRTFVIGAPGSEPARGFLSELARSGGTAKQAGTCSADRTSSSGDCHYDMTSTTDFAADLSQALDEISGSAIGCQFAVPQPADRPESRNVNVQYRPGGTGDPICLALDNGPCDAGADGFQFAKNTDGTDDLSKVVLCGSACATIQADPDVQVDVVLGCEPFVLE